MKKPKRDEPKPTRQPRSRTTASNSQTSRAFVGDAFDRAIGLKIKSLRKHRKLSQTEMAIGLDISYQMLQRHENGSSPISIGRLVEVAKLLKVPVLDFFPLPIASVQATVDHLTQDEIEFLAAFRKIPDQELKSLARQMILRISKPLAR